MPLPPRDLTALHLSLNPALAELHALYPLSRFAPAVSLFRLFKMSFEGCPLAAALDITSWMTLACLDDLSGDYCVGCAAMAWHQTGGDRALINATFAHSAAPFTVPMMVAVPPSPWPPAPPPAPRIPAPAPPAPAPSAARLHGSVVRVICALVKDAKGKVDLKLFDLFARRLQRMSSASACKALRDFAGQLRAAAPEQDRAKMLSAVLAKYEGKSEAAN